MFNENQVVIFYHANCRDGLISAYNMKKLVEGVIEQGAYITAFFREINYRDETSIVKPFEELDYQLPVQIIFVDYIPDLQQFEQLANTFNLDRGRTHITVLDHHFNNISNFFTSLLRHFYQNKDKLTKPEQFHTESSLSCSLIARGKETTYVSLFDVNNPNNPTYMDKVVGDVTYLKADGSKMWFDIRIIGSFDNTYSGATLTLLNWFPERNKDAGKIANFVENTFKYEHRKMLIDDFVFVDNQQSLKNFIKLSLHISDGDLYNWKFEKSDEFITALNEDLVALDFDFEKCCYYLDDLIEDKHAFDFLYQTGSELLEPVRKEIQKAATSITKLKVSEVVPYDIPVYVASKSIVSKLSHHITAELKQHKTVFIISSMNEDKGQYNARVGSNDGSAVIVAESLSGGGHPNAAGVVLLFDYFNEEQHAVIRQKLKEVESFKLTCC